MSEILCQEIFKELSNKYQVHINPFYVRKFWNKYNERPVSSVSWLELCDDVKEFECNKYIFVFLFDLLKQELYSGDFSKELYALLPSFQKVIDGNKFNTEFLFVGTDIPNLIIFKNRDKECQWSYAVIDELNNGLRELMTDFLNSDRKYTRWHNQQILLHSVKSLGRFKDGVKSYKDYNGTTFWEQIDYYRNLFRDDEKTLNSALCGIINFYRWLVNKYDEYNFFENDLKLTKQLLFNVGFLQIVKKNFFVTTFNQTNDVSDYERVCFIMRNMDNLSTNIKKEDFFSVDLSSVESKFYRKLIMQYIVNTTNITIVTWSGQTQYICEGMSFVNRLKSQKDYPNCTEKYLNNQEAVFIKNFFVDEKLKISTLNNKIGAVRRFLLWCKDNNYIEFDELFFDYLKQYEEPSFNSGKSVPDEHLKLINNYIVEDSKNNHTAKLAYAIFHLAIQTEFRISQICHLKIDCIQPSIKPNQYYVCSNSKTSSGSQDKYVITDTTYHILMSIIDDTEEIRDRCNIESMKEYIFLTDGISNSVALYDTNMIRLYMKKACADLDIPLYTATNLRDTHMTKAFEYTLRHGLSDVEMGLITRHKQIDTTKNHYIDMELSKMLEATYGITIGKEYVDIGEKIVDEIPKNAQGKDSDVEYGCGKCIANECVSNSPFPCMVCEHFITTIKHEKYFEKAIENIDKMIEHSQIKHDKEDLITIKRLYVSYLKAIFIKKGEYEI